MRRRDGFPLVSYAFVLAERDNTREIMIWRQRTHRIASSETACSFPNFEIVPGMAGLRVVICRTAQYWTLLHVDGFRTPRELVGNNRPRRI